MRRYLLDSVVIADFQRGGMLGALTQAAAIVPMAIVDEVHSEMTYAPAGASPERIARAREAGRALAGAAPQGRPCGQSPLTRQRTESIPPGGRIGS